VTREVPTCSSGKKGYRSEQAALNAAKKEASRFYDGMPPGARVALIALYAYRCDREGCDQFHRTKNPPRKAHVPLTLNLPDVPPSRRSPDPLKDLEALESAIADAIRRQGPGLRYPTKDVVVAQYGIPTHVADILRNRLRHAGLLVFREFEENGTYRTTRPPVSLFD